MRRMADRPEARERDRLALHDTGNQTYIVAQATDLLVDAIKSVRRAALVEDIVFERITTTGKNEYSEMMEGSIRFAMKVSAAWPPHRSKIWIEVPVVGGYMYPPQSFLDSHNNAHPLEGSAVEKHIGASMTESVGYRLPTVEMAVTDRTLLPPMPAQSFFTTAGRKRTAMYPDAISDGEDIFLVDPDNPSDFMGNATYWGREGDMVIIVQNNEERLVHKDMVRRYTDTLGQDNRLARTAELQKGQHVRHRPSGDVGTVINVDLTLDEVTVRYEDGATQYFMSEDAEKVLDILSPTQYLDATDDQTTTSARRSRTAGRSYEEFQNMDDGQLSAEFDRLDELTDPTADEWAELQLLNKILEERDADDQSQDDDTDYTDYDEVRWGRRAGTEADPAALQKYGPGEIEEEDDTPTSIPVYR